MKILVFFALGLAFMAEANPNRYSENGNYLKYRCEPIAMPMCIDIAYNETIFPNLMGNQNQEDASNNIHIFQPLVKIKCSPDIQLFLCSMYAPVCTDLGRPLKPCRSLCESARKGCEDLMKTFDYDWPANFECSRFPESAAEEICMMPGPAQSTNNFDLGRFKTSTIGPARLPNAYEDMMDFICPAQMSAPKDLGYSLRVGNTTAPDCGTPCYGMFFNEDDVGALRTWTGVMAIFALLPCLFAVITFLLDSQRFPYPQMAIIHMSICYMVFLILHIISFVSGDSLACGAPFESEQPNLEPERLIRQGTIEDWRCSVVGMALYFFKMASALWWVMLTVAWFLNAGLKWGSEALESSYMHAIVWTVAAFQTVLVIVFKEISGDIYTGACYIGLWDSHTLLKFEIIPLVVYHIIGIFALFMGMVSLFQVRNEQKRAGARTDKLESLLIRIGVFAFLYLTPALTAIGLTIYEWQHLDIWMTHWQERVCRDEVLRSTWQVPCRQPGPINPIKDEPWWGFYIFKYAAIFLTAAFSGTWVWASKTWTAWKQCLQKTCGGPQDNVYDTPQNARPL